MNGYWSDVDEWAWESSPPTDELPARNETSGDHSSALDSEVTIVWPISLISHREVEEVLRRHRSETEAEKFLNLSAKERSRRTWDRLEEKMVTMFKMLGVDNCGANEGEEEEVLSGGFIDKSLSLDGDIDEHVEMLCLIDAGDIKSSLSYDYNVIGDDSLSKNELIVVENELNDIVTKPAYEGANLNHTDAGLSKGELNLVDSFVHVLKTLVGMINRDQSWELLVSRFRGGTRVCLNLTVDSFGVNCSTGFWLNMLDENPVEVGKASPMPVNQLWCKAWVERATGFRGGTMLFKIENWIQMSTCFSAGVLEFEGHWKRLTLLKESNFIWKVAWLELLIVWAQKKNHQ
ncbi:OLC1v1023980C1 [Oldenlandia corymbosa var. corymbosa]|uniref:OLC1v1023980C1 n=1 Tax=Oldenlandia corymbosa var. corymbosa TaxID=529605 RepID=A0AAV1C177_OLDCO|nr:OLC1v1023980C1 [Oldenlandia corymbosa var. corymbosa]